LIDAITGSHCWAERYDRELSGVFAVQDEVTRAIVYLHSRLRQQAEAEHTLLKPPATWEAYDYLLARRGSVLAGVPPTSGSSIYEARRFLKNPYRPIELCAAYAVRREPTCHTGNLAIMII